MLIQIESIVDSLEEYRHVDGKFLGPFLQKIKDSDNYFVQLPTSITGRQRLNKRQQFEEDRQLIISEIIKHIKGRLPQLDLLDDVQVCELF